MKILIQKLTKKISDFKKNKFINDVSWNVVNAIIIGIIGILNNIIITKYFGATGLGNFNIALSIYTILYYFTVLGINNAVIKFISENTNNENNKRGIISSAIIIVFFNSILFSILLFLLSPFLAVFYEKASFINILKIFLIALPIYSLNKIFLSYLNGIREMKAYSGFLTLRVLFIFIFIFISSNFTKDLFIVSFSIPSSELLIFVIINFKYNFLKKLSFKVDFFWLKKNIHFGIFTVINDIFVDLYFKTDTLILSYFANPYLVGIYVFSTDIAKGISQFAILIQINFNPIISKLWNENKKEDLLKKIKKIKSYTYKSYTFLILLCSILYIPFIKLFVSEMDCMENYICFFILTFGIYLFSGYHSLIGLIFYTGYTKLLAQRSFFLFIFNVLFCIILIPFMGIYGAATSMFISLLLNIFTLKWFALNKLKIKI